jgi:oligoendopeptidase F
MKMKGLCSIIAIPMATAFTMPISVFSARTGVGTSLPSTTTTTCLATTDASSFINQVNKDYEELHRAFEKQFWGTKMALSDPVYSVEELNRTKGEMEKFLADEEKLSKTRELLSTLSSDDTSDTAKTLRIFERTFGCYIMESKEAKQLRAEATEIEGRLENERNNMVLGAMIDGNFEEMSSVALRSKIRVESDEKVRKACYEGLGKIGDFVTEHGFVELVKVRNKMAKALGYQDYYDYKVTQAEGFGKDELFKILDTLEEGSRSIMRKARDRFAAEKGDPSALEPWNLSFFMAGDVTKKMDPYFPFEKSVEQWGRSFAKMNISYRGASMDLDLLDRKRKYSNGFCHWPQPAWVKPDGTFQPAVTHFTSLADPSIVGSGLVGLTTLMHEAGHAAHMANVVQPSPLFSQERAPTSVPYAELQSMFLDALVGDAAWRAKYAISREGIAIPWDIIQEDLEASHPYKVFALRGMIAVPYFEKALYEMDENELNAESIKSLADKIEHDIQGGLSPRPLLSVPHLLSDEASCYYHGYVLAEMAVHQTREFVIKRDGYIVDNPNIGPLFTEAYWKPGNSEPFLSLVEKCTGKPLSGDAWIEVLNQDIEELCREEKEAYLKASAERDSEPVVSSIDLDMRIRIVDGDQVLADTQTDGSFLATCAKFEKYVQDHYTLPVSM